MDAALLRVVVASREFQNVDDLMTDVANGGSARLLAFWALAMQINRRSRKDFARLLFAHVIRKKPRWYTLFSNQLLCVWRLLRKMAAPHAQSQDVPISISLSWRTRRLLAPTGLVHAAMPSLAANARQQATWLWQSMQNHQMALRHDNWVKKNFGVDPLHPDHSINGTVVAVLHLPALPPFPGHLSLIDAVQTNGARVDALQLRHADLLRRVYALPDMIQRTFVRVPLDIVRQNVLSLRWQPMMLSQLRCGTKLDHLKLLNTIRHVQHATRHDLPLCVDMQIHYELLKYLYGESCTSWNFHLQWSSLPLIYGVWHPYKHMITMLYRNFMPIMCFIARVHNNFKEGDAVPTKVKLLHMEKTILALCLNAGTYLPRVQAKLDACAVAAQNEPLTDMQSKSKELLLGLKVLLKEYCPAAFRIGVLVRDSNWARMPWQCWSPVCWLCFLWWVINGRMWSTSRHWWLLWSHGSIGTLERPVVFAVRNMGRLC